MQVENTSKFLLKKFNEHNSAIHAAWLEVERLITKRGDFLVFLKSKHPEVFLQVTLARQKPKGDKNESK